MQESKTIHSFHSNYEKCDYRVRFSCTLEHMIVTYNQQVRGSNPSSDFLLEKVNKSCKYKTDYDLILPSDK